MTLSGPSPTQRRLLLLLIVEPTAPISRLCQAADVCPLSPSLLYARLARLRAHGWVEQERPPPGQPSRWRVTAAGYAAVGLAPRPAPRRPPGRVPPLSAHHQTVLALLAAHPGLSTPALGAHFAPTPPAPVRRWLTQLERRGLIVGRLPARAPFGTPYCWYLCPPAEPPPAESSRA